MVRVQYPAISEQQRGCTLEVQIDYGSRRDELAYTFVQSLVLIPIAIMMWPDPSLMVLRLDFVEVVRTCFLALIVVGTAAFVIPAIRAKPPTVLRFSPSSISYESGRPPVDYLLNNSGGRLSHYLALLCTQRVDWIITRDELRAGQILMSTVDGCLTLRVGDRSYRFARTTPECFIPRIAQLVNGWVATEMG